MNRLSILFCINFLILDEIWAQNISKTDVWSSAGYTVENDTIVFSNQTNSTSTQTYNDLRKTDNQINLSENKDRNKKKKNKLDNSISALLESLMSMLLETKHVFNEELNTTKTDSEAKDVWIAYSNSWDRVFTSLIKDITSKTLESSDSSSFPDFDVSLECLQSVISTAFGLKRQKDWAVKLIDSSGRPFIAGSLDGTITSLGAYDQCLSIETDPETEPRFVGQYCILKYRIALPPKPKHLTLQSKVFNFTNTPIEGTFLEEFAHSAHAFYDRFGRIGICIPSSCNNRDFENIVKKFIAESHLNLSINDCHTNEWTQLSSLQITIASIFCIIASLMIISTSIDIIVDYTVNTSNEFISFESRTRKLVLSTIQSFSVYSNGKYLFNTNTESNRIECINGVRVLSMVWILYTHTYLIPIKETFSFARDFMFTIEELGFQLILNGWVLVDSFFLLGAMLTTYSHLKAMRHSEGKINILQLTMNRFFRFSPSIWFTVSLVFLIPSLASGPLWREYFDVQLDKCMKNWWTTFTFINNWFDESNMCLLHTWYLSADMQLFIVAFIFIIPLYKKPNLGIKLIAIAIISSCLAIGIRTYMLNQPPTVLYNTPNERDVYDQASAIYVHTYIHLGPYFIGILLGYVLIQKREYTINPFLNLLIWLTVLFCLLGISLSTYSLNRGIKWSSFSTALYAGLHRTAWSIGIGWIVFACATGNGGPINAFLSWKFFTPLGKLSFMIYLMHFLVIWVRYAYIRQPLPFSHYIMFCEFLTNLVISICLSIVTFLAIEAPMMSLYRLYLSNILKFASIQVNRESKENPNIQNEIVVTSKL